MHLISAARLILAEVNCSIIENVSYLELKVIELFILHDHLQHFK